MPTVYLDSHGSELVLKVARKTCSELLKYIANYTAVWFSWNSTCTALTFTKSVLFSLAVSFLLGFFVLFPEVPSLFHLGSRKGMKWLPGFRYVCVNACDRLCFCGTQTTSHSISFPASFSSDHSLFLWHHQTLSLCKTVHMLFCSVHFWDRKESVEISCFSTHWEENTIY